MQSLDPAVLGRLILLHNVIQVLTEEKKIAEIIEYEFLTIPGVAAAFFRFPGRMADLPPEAGEKVELEVSTFRTTVGKVVLHVSDPALFEPYLPFLCNVLNFTALHIENERSQNNLLELNRILALDVEERARKLMLQGLVLDQISDMVVLTDLEGIITYVNRAELAILGYRPEDVVGRHVSVFGESALFGAKQNDVVRGTISSGEWSGQIVNRKADGQEVILELKTKVIRDKSGVFVALCGVSRDITERIRARQKEEESLLRQAEELKSIFRIQRQACFSDAGEKIIIKQITEELCRVIDSSAAAVFVSGRGNGFFECRDIYDSFMGRHLKCAAIEPEKIAPLLDHLEQEGFHVSDCDACDQHIESLKQVFSDAGVKQENTNFLVSTIWISDRAAGFVCVRRSFRGRLWEKDEISYVSHMADQIGLAIAEKGKTEAESGKEILAAAVEQSGEAVIITDSEANIEYVNQAFSSMTGYSMEEVKGENPKILSSGRHDSLFYDKLWEAISRGGVWRGQFINRKKSGELYTEDAVISPVRDKEGNIVNYIAVKRDITEQERVKEERDLYERQYNMGRRLEAIGQLAGGIAHDLNNLLSPVLGYSDILLSEVNLPYSFREPVREIYTAGIKARNLVKQLLAFAKKQNLRVQTYDLNSIVAGFSRFLRSTIRENISIETRLYEEPLYIQADEGQIEQVIMNLAINAQDAMPDGGLLLLETAPADLDKEDASPGRYALLSVSDSGAGIAPEIAQKIFEPFFSTKGEGGTGLGLSTVYGIARQHSGHITLESKPEGGTVFSVYLPLSKEAEIKNSEKEHHPGIRGGEEHILVVEDNFPAGKLVKSILEKLGYTVLMAATGEEALSMIAPDIPIDLLLTDVIMPGINGQELYEKCLEKKPDIKVLFMSGYTKNVTLEGENRSFIQKPFSVNELSSKVREVLDSK